MLTRRLHRFIAIGCTAAALHFAVVVLLVGGAGWPPLGANVAGWGLALGLSFMGHWRWSFGDQQAPLGRSARRFVLLSATGFAINEAAYAVLLRFSGIGYALALAIVLVAVAVLTYAFSRHWAFQGSAVPRP
ncbi:MAG: GtrA family protein [Burkholderiales bacterium]|nr:GtrA family protein [Burkholderiales bacterium]